MGTQKQIRLAELISVNIRAEKPRSVKELMIEAGYTESTADASTRIVQSKNFLEVLEDAGVTDDKLAVVMQEGLNANKVISAKIVGKDADGQTDDFIEVPDHPTRHKFMESSLKIKGHSKQDGVGNTYNTFVQQNNLNPNAPAAKELVESTLEMLMNQTKRDIKE